MSKNLNILDWQFNNLSKVIELDEFKNFLLLSKDMTDENYNIFFNNYLQLDIRNIKDLLKLLLNCFAEKLDLKLQSDVNNFNDDIEAMSTFVNSKFNESMSEFVYEASNYRHKKKLTEAQKVTMNLWNHMKDERSIKFPVNFFIVIGAVLGFQEMPASESWVHAGKSFNMRKICMKILNCYETFIPYFNENFD